MNFLWLYLYTEKDGDDIPVGFDDVVVATDYIGPLYAPKREAPSEAGSADAGR